MKKQTNLWCQILDGLTFVTFLVLRFSAERSKLPPLVTPCENVLMSFDRCQNFFIDFQGNVNKDGSVDSVATFDSKDKS